MSCKISYLFLGPSYCNTTSHLIDGIISLYSIQDIEDILLHVSVFKFGVLLLGYSSHSSVSE